MTGTPGRRLAMAAAVILAASSLACESRQRPVVQSAKPTASAGACRACHKSHVRQWQSGGHGSIACQACHGAGESHTRATSRPRPKMSPTGGSRACLACHQQVGSFEAHVRAIETKHKIKANMERAAGQCSYCHDPHSLQ